MKMKATLWVKMVLLHKRYMSGGDLAVSRTSTLYKEKIDGTRRQSAKIAREVEYENHVEIPF
jgi:hypothetical protein